LIFSEIALEKSNLRSPKPSNNLMQIVNASNKTSLATALSMLKATLSLTLLNPRPLKKIHQTETRQLDLHAQEQLTSSETVSVVALILALVLQVVTATILEINPAVKLRLNVKTSTFLATVKMPSPIAPETYSATVFEYLKTTKKNQNFESIRKSKK